MVEISVLWLHLILGKVDKSVYCSNQTAAAADKTQTRPQHRSLQALATIDHSDLFKRVTVELGWTLTGTSETQRALASDDSPRRRLSKVRSLISQPHRGSTAYYRFNRRRKGPNQSSSSVWKSLPIKTSVVIDHQRSRQRSCRRRRGHIRSRQSYHRSGSLK